MSASAPAGTASRNTGAVVAACTSATISGVGANDVMSHPAPPSCIQDPMLEMMDANHSMRKTRCCSGAHAAVAMAELSKARDPFLRDDGHCGESRCGT